MSNPHFGIPSRKEILDHLSPKRPMGKRLFISPILDKDQIGDTSIDLHLGHWFLAPKASRLGLLNVVDIHNEEESLIGENYSDYRVPFGQYFTLHPKSSVQIGTLEYLGIPTDLEGIVTLRASISNLPIISNAAQVHPGHRGIISLTLTSNSEFSIALSPGIQIAELQLRYVSSPVENPRPSRYHYMTKPLPSELYKDKNLEYLGHMTEPIIIGIVSTIAAGRTTAINHLIDRHGFTGFSLAEILKEEATKFGIATLRPNLQDFGTTLRETHGDAHLAVKLKTSARWQKNKHILVIVDSFKNVAEVDEFRKQKRFTLIGIDASIEKRWERVQSRRRQGDPTNLDEFKKQDAIDRGPVNIIPHGQQVEKLLEMADYTVYNNGVVGDFITELDKIVSGLIYSA